MPREEDNYRTYQLEKTLMVNGIEFSKVVISSHYERKHPEVTDELILKLIKQLDGKEFTNGKTRDS